MKNLVLIGLCLALTTAAARADCASELASVSGEQVDTTAATPRPGEPRGTPPTSPSPAPDATGPAVPQASMPGAGPSVQQEAEADAGSREEALAQARDHLAAGREAECLEAVQRARDAS